MARRKRYNPEKTAWRGRSYRKGGKRIRSLREHYRGNRVLQDGELQEGLVVWAVYWEYDAAEPKVDGAYPLEKGVGDSWVVGDSGMDWDPGFPDEACIQDRGPGEARLFEAIQLGKEDPDGLKGDYSVRIKQWTGAWAAVRYYPSEEAALWFARNGWVGPREPIRDCIWAVFHKSRKLVDSRGDVW